MRRPTPIRLPLDSCRACLGFGIIRWRCNRTNPLVGHCRVCNGTGKVKPKVAA